MKHIREIAVVLLLVVAGVAFTLQAQDQTKKNAPAQTKKTEHVSKMKSKSGCTMPCCQSDSTTCAKDAKDDTGKH